MRQHSVRRAGHIDSVILSDNDRPTFAAWAPKLPSPERVPIEVKGADIGISFATERLIEDRCLRDASDENLTSTVSRNRWRISQVAKLAQPNGLRPVDVAVRAKFADVDGISAGAGLIDAVGSTGTIHSYPAPFKTIEASRVTVRTRPNDIANRRVLA
ncbi:MAG: hypothetical protein AB7P40_29465, partial [Chloroflexota bacterium]